MHCPGIPKLCYQFLKIFQFYTIIADFEVGSFVAVDIEEEVKVEWEEDGVRQEAGVEIELEVENDYGKVEVEIEYEDDIDGDKDLDDESDEDFDDDDDDE